MNRLLFISISIFIVLTSFGQSTKSGNAKQPEKLSETSTEIETTTTDHKTEKIEIIENVYCTHFEFSSVEQQADSILSFMEKAKNSSSANRILWEQKFFCAFPNSFKGMQAVFGYDYEKGPAPLYYEGENVIQYFSCLESIPDSIYYDKYVRINIDGVWEADNIIKAFGFANRLITDTENACNVLSKFSDKEIKSVFYFIFDGPHPKNEYNEKLYKKLKSKIDNHNKRLSRLLTESYEKLMAEDDGHGH